MIIWYPPISIDCLPISRIRSSSSTRRMVSVDQNVINTKRNARGKSLLQKWSSPSRSPKNGHVLTAQSTMKVGREHGRISCKLIKLIPYKIDGRLSCELPHLSGESRLSDRSFARTRAQEKYLEFFAGAGGRFLAGKAPRTPAEQEKQWTRHEK